MNITLKVNSSEINAGILGAIRGRLNDKLHLTADGIRRDLAHQIEAFLNNSPEAKSITGGVLEKELEIPNAQAVIHDILSILKDSIDCTINPVTFTGNSVRGGLNIVLFRQTLDHIISLGSGKYQGKYFEVPWLDWLLTQGDRIIVAGYNLNITSPAKASTVASARTGIQQMELGGGWRIPPNFSGTTDDNWITRTFSGNNVEDKINDIVKNNLLKYFS